MDRRLIFRHPAGRLNRPGTPDRIGSGW